MLLIDSDPIVYRAGFASERGEYLITYDDGHSVQQRQFGPTEGKSAGDNKKEWLGTFSGEVLAEERIVYPEPEGNALQILRTQVSAVLDANRGQEARFYLTGSGNFRDKIAKVKPYKGNRDKPRPVHYKAIREYLVSNYKAIVVDGMEADDMLSILSWKSGNNDTIATIDKDLDQIPGRHYDYLKHVHYTVSHEGAAAWFWQQCLSGDPTDNIGGCWKCGPTKAQKLVSGWYTGSLEPRDIWNAIVAQYVASQKRPDCPYRDFRPEAVALETAQLVYLLTEEGQLWQPPK